MLSDRIGLIAIRHDDHCVQQFPFFRDSGRAPTWPLYSEHNVIPSETKVALKDHASISVRGLRFHVIV